MKLLTPKEWILEYHPDPDNIHECNYNVDYHDEFSEGNFTYPIKEDVAYKLMKQYSDYVLKERMKEPEKSIIRIDAILIELMENLGENDFTIAGEAREIIHKLNL